MFILLIARDLVALTYALLKIKPYFVPANSDCNTQITTLVNSELLFVVQKTTLNRALGNCSRATRGIKELKKLFREK